jgi:hypothetical protein
MMMWGPPMRFFWFMPLLFLVMFMVRAFLFKRGSIPDRAKMPFLPEKKSQTLSEKRSSGSIPEGLKQAGQQVLEGLDWEIRLLERQQATIEDPRKRQEIEEELQRKRDEYQTTVNRLEL